jgi:hypothetical protein
MDRASWPGAARKPLPLLLLRYRAGPLLPQVGDTG